MRWAAILSGAIAMVVTGEPLPLAAQQARMERDVVYGHKDGMAMVYDVALPADANGAGVVFVISGGYLSTLEQQRMISPVAAPLLDAGFAIFYLRHPSTPRYLAPAIHEAVATGLDHILANSARFGVDPARIGTLGMSTGATLSLMLALDHPSDSRWDAGERPAASVAYMPAVDMRDNVGNVGATPSLGFDPELAPGLSPIDAVSSDDPPTLMIHGDHDLVLPIESNSARLSAAMTENGVVTELLVVDAGHELFAGDVKDQADRAVVGWFERYLLDRGR